MWVQLPGVNKEMYRYDADDRESASVAHIYGQNIAAAESMTSLRLSRRLGVVAVHAEAYRRHGIHQRHQPICDSRVGPPAAHRQEKAPGMTLGPCGQWFNRNETWAEQAGPWVDYLSRTSFMLQQGHFGADLIYFYGEDSNLTAIFVDKPPNVPAGYGFDYVNADALIHELSVSERPHHDAGRHKLSACSDSIPSAAHVVARAARHPQTGGERCGCCRPKTHRRSKPRRRSGRSSAS